MKNLKKALVLVLAFAMIFSMFTMNASAASFSDGDAIVNDEAVATMVQLGVINGYEDGTFLPTQVVTRAEMCKMICVAMNGGTAPILDASTVVFSDTKGHWANAYISYCFGKGIVSGDSGKGGAFRPDATVTGIEAAKMMLVALGYNSAIGGFTSADWANNVVMAANDKSLFTNLGALNVVAGLSRDNAAQLIYNGMKAEMVTYSNILGTDANGQLTSTPTISNLAGKTVLTEKFGVSVLEGVILSSENGTMNSADATNIVGETTMFVKTDDSTVVNANYTLKTSTPADMVGKTVKVYVKDSGLTGTTYNTIYGAPVLTSTNRVKTFTGAGYTNVADFTAALKTAGINGFTAFAAADGVVVATNYGHILDNTTYYGAAAATMTPSNGNALLGRGKEVTFIDNDNDGLVDVVKIMSKHVGQVTVLNSAGNSGKGTITVAAKNGSAATTNPLTSKTYEDVYGEENVALNDYVLYYELNGKYYVEKATSATADVTKTTPSTTAVNGTATAGGVVYRQSALVTTVDGSNVLAAAATLGKSTQLFFDNFGNVIYIKAVASAEKYLMVTAVGTPDALSGLQVKVVNEEGTVSVVYLDSITVGANKISTSNSDGNPAAATTDMEDTLANNHTGGAGFRAPIASTIFTYTVKDNGKYALTVPSSGTTRTTTTAVSTSNPTLATSNDIANTNTIFVIKTSSTSYTKYVGIASVVNVSAATSVVTYQKSTSTAVNIAFFHNGTIASASTSGVFICSTAYSEVLNGTTKVYEYPAIIDGQTTTVTATGTGIFTTVGYYGTGISLNSKGQYTAAKRSAYMAPVTTVGNGVINGFTYDDSVKVFEISSSGAVTESAIGNIYDGTNGTDNSAVIIVAKGSSAPNNTVAKYVFVKGKALTTAASTPTSVTLAQGSVGSVTVDAAGDLMAGTRAVTGWVATEAVKVTVADAAGTTSTITINGTTVASGADYIPAATGTYTVIVNVTAAGYTGVEYVYTFTVAA